MDVRESCLCICPRMSKDIVVDRYKCMKCEAWGSVYRHIARGLLIDSKALPPSLPLSLYLSLSLSLISLYRTHIRCHLCLFGHPCSKHLGIAPQLHRKNRECSLGLDCESAPSILSDTCPIYYQLHSPLLSVDLGCLTWCWKYSDWDNCSPDPQCPRVEASLFCPLRTDRVQQWRWQQNQ